MLLSCGVAFISYLDRAILGVTILPMAAELGWDESFEGAISRYHQSSLFGNFEPELRVTSQHMFE